uniref:Uncharacterized protein n=1 Tax=Anguilla anguilla TaxID=7936 RepID=A0A0E9UA80_ANGAN
MFNLYFKLCLFTMRSLVFMKGNRTHKPGVK